MSIASGNLSVTGDVSISSGLTVSGNLTVAGTTTTLNATDVEIGDRIITLNANATGTPLDSQDAGIEIERGDSNNVQFIWDESEDSWSFGTGTVVAGKFKGDGSGLTGISSSGLAADSVGTSQLASDAVTGVKIADNAMWIQIKLHQMVQLT